MNVALPRPISPAEFLVWEESQNLPYEFDGLGPVAMTGGSAAHDRITFNLRTAIERRILSPCQAFSSDMKILVQGRARYPNVLITGRPPPPEATVAEHPIVVFEIISQSNAHTDHIEKVVEYQSTSSIQRYVMLEQTMIGATVFARHGEFWHATILRSGDTVTLTEVDIQFPLDDCYARLEFGSD